MAWCAFLLILIVLVCTFKLRPYWWTFFDIFFLFLMAFSHCMALTVERFNRASARRLDTIALVMAVLAVISLVVEGLLLAFLPM